ncbi:MAG: methyl-accepting chemotaxis protein, partial [Bacteroidota bacterium]
MIARLRIPARLAILTIAMGVFLAAVAGMGIQGMTSILASLRTVYEDRTVSLIQLAEVQQSFMKMRLLAVAFRETTDPQVQERIKRDLDAQDREMEKIWREYRSDTLTAEETRIANDIERTLTAYRATVNRYLVALSSGDRETGMTITRTEGAQAGAALEKLIEEDFRLQADVARQEYEKGDRTSHNSITLSLVAAGLALLVGGGLAFGIVASITRPLGHILDAMARLAKGDLNVDITGQERVDEVGDISKAVQVFKQSAVDKKRMEDEAEAAREAQAKAEAEQRAREAAIVAEVAQVATAASQGDLERRIDLNGKDGFLLNLCEGVNNLVNLTGIALKDVASVLAAVARGDLTQRIVNQYGGLFGQLKGDVNQTADKLFEIVTNINGAAGQIGSAASEVAAGSQDLSERSEQQASALEETAASMEELAATVRQNAANAQQANQLAAGAREIAAGGGEVVNNAITAMGRIEQSSQKIEDIVGMIDEIAFQTNLLALNAAVEAARAGDAGKGFAVVAQEVRNLAQRSAQASKEIKTLIAESSTQVRGGAELVKGAGKTLEDILGSVKRVADIVAEIAAASSEQASGIDQVNSAV